MPFLDPVPHVVLLVQHSFACYVLTFLHKINSLLLVLMVSLTSLINTYYYILDPHIILSVAGPPARRRGEKILESFIKVLSVAREI